MVLPSTSRASTPNRSRERSGWQFSLWHLFAATTYVAFAATIAKNGGWGTLVVTLCLGVAIVNWAGAFTRWQQGRIQTRLLVASWLMFLVSLLLPSVTVFGPVQGWEAAWCALALPWEKIGQGPFQWGMLLWLGASAANLLQVLLPLLIWRLRHERGQWLSSAYCILSVCPWICGWSDMHLLVGYYIWSASFLLGMIALPITRTTLILMFLVAGLMAMSSYLAN